MKNALIYVLAGVLAVVTGTAIGGLVQACTSQPAKVAKTAIVIECAVFNSARAELAKYETQEELDAQDLACNVAKVVLGQGGAS
jgi:hypothetical protein